ncbi:hypothetical protein E1281_32330 [Actinomadura sp. KC345]|uniref:hypothetical protein n=1 Tax=Actinomadura sp. KC345 TaxID=2530371 RepID=UPI00104A9090|nr:hypothetical protein [Actinomadura sp. KC345]TDC44874.1 hypothetical protein E1281_32330 [Actinomadura sp. KC345]
MQDAYKPSTFEHGRGGLRRVQTRPHDAAWRRSCRPTLTSGKATSPPNHIAEGKVEGRAEGKAELLLIVLESHGFTIDDDLRERITSCQDLEQIHTWARRVATADSLDEIFT